MSNIIYHNHQVIRTQYHKLRTIWQVQEHHVVKIIRITNDNSKSSMFYYPNAAILCPIK